MRAGCRTGRVRCGRPAERHVCIVTSSLETPRTKAVLFDIDGTLIDTGGAGARSWRWAFERLHGVPAGIVSGGLEGSARIKLERGHLNRYLPVGAFGTDSRDRHEITRVAIARVSTMHGRDIEPGEVIVVGDTPLDVDAAKAVGAISLG